MNLSIDIAALNAGDGPVRAIDEGATVRFLIRGRTASVVALKAGEGVFDLLPDRDVGHKALKAALGA